MDDETQVPVPSAAPDVPAPTPAPLPIPVTGAGSPYVTRSRTRTWIFVGIAVALLALALIAAIGFVVTVATRADVGHNIALGTGLGKRVAAEYPGYRLISASSQLATESGVASFQRRFFVTMSDPKVKGFTVRFVYTAPDTSEDAEDFVNSDTFFASTVTTEQPVGSFERMWVKAHPDTTCLFVHEVETSTESTRVFAVGYTRNQETFRVVDDYFAYSVGAGSWHPVSQVDAFLGQGGTGGMPADPSDVGTAALIAGTFPEFEEYRPYRTSTGTWESVIRHRKHTGVLIAVDPDMLPYYDDSDGEKELLGAPSKRGEAFMRAWESRHRGMVISWMSFDPDTDGHDRLLEVGYAPFQKDSPFLAETRYARLEYVSSSRGWVWRKVPKY